MFWGILEAGVLNFSIILEVPHSIEVSTIKSSMTLASWCLNFSWRSTIRLFNRKKSQNQFLTTQFYLWNTKKLYSHLKLKCLTLGLDFWEDEGEIIDKVKKKKKKEKFFPLPSFQNLNEEWAFPMKESYFFCLFLCVFKPSPSFPFCFFKIKIFMRVCT